MSISLSYLSASLLRTGVSKLTRVHTPQLSRGAVRCGGGAVRVRAPSAAPDRQREEVV